MQIEGQTNVLSSRFGPGAADGIGRDLGRFVVATMELPWTLAKERIGGTPEAVVYCTSMELDVVERQFSELPPCDAILAVGGGQAVDLGKYLAWKSGRRLVTVPTILSVDAFVTPAAAVRRNRQVEYVGEASPDPLVIDYELLRTAPNELNIAGVGDLVSIHTACRDWEIAGEAGRSEFPFDPAAVAAGRDILGRILGDADAIRRCTDEGLQALVDGYLRINAVCLPAGHYRIEEGSEHYVFYELEERLGRPFLHGAIVGLGVYLMSRLQENDAERITDFLDEVGLRYHPADLQIDRPSLVESLRSLRPFVESRPKLWYTVINERDATLDWIEEAMVDLRFL